MTESALVYELAVPIRRGDMDAMGHVNNTVPLPAEVRGALAGPPGALV
jgi:hypothetical protein